MLINLHTKFAEGATCLCKIASIPPGRLVETRTHTLGTPSTTGVPIRFTSTESTSEDGNENVVMARSLRGNRFDLTSVNLCIT